VAYALGESEGGEIVENWGWKDGWASDELGDDYPHGGLPHLIARAGRGGKISERNTSRANGKKEEVAHWDERSLFWGLVPPLISELTERLTWKGAVCNASETASR